MTGLADPGIAAEELERRVDRLLRLLGDEGLTSAVVTAPRHVYYLTGVEPAGGLPAAVLVTADNVQLVWPGAPPQPGLTAATVLGYDPYAPSRGNGETLDRVLGALVSETGVSADRLGIDELLPGTYGQLAPKLFTRLIRGKSSAEVAIIERNLAANDAAFTAVSDRLRPGATDLDVFVWCSSALSDDARGSVAYDGNIGLGANGDFFDAQPTGIRAQAGDPLFVDLYVRQRHYVGDSTRSFVAGRAPAWLTEAHRRLEQAIERVETLLRPGAIAGDVDAICRQTVAASEIGASFPHHTGHGVGLSAQEPPYIVNGSRDQIANGDVIAIEPGIYFPGRGGLRLEEVYLVTDDAARALTRFPRVLSQCR